MGSLESQEPSESFPQLEGHSSNVKSNAVGQYLARHFDGFTPSDFPCLSGLRKEAYSDTVIETSWIGRLAYRDLESAAEQLNYLPEAALQAAWASLLSAYSNPEQEDIAFEAAVSNGIPNAAATDIPWTTIPVRVTTEGQRSAISSLDVVRELSEHWKVMTSTTVDGSLVTNNEVIKKPYDSLLIFQPSEQQPSSSDYGRDLLKRGQMAVVVIKSITATGVLNYKALSTNKHLSKDAAVLMLRQLDEVVQSIVTASQRAFRTVFESVSQSLKSMSNHRLDGAYPPLRFPVLHGQFEEHAALHPNDEALVYVAQSKRGQMSSRNWTYGALNTEAACLAQGLTTTFGDLKGRVIPILMVKEPLLYITILAILKAGGAWCPVDPLSPFDRRCELIARTESNFVIVSGSFAEEPLIKRLPGIRVFDLADFNLHEVKAANHLHFSSRSGSIASTDAAYVIWTSGTTGPPKGVVISHEAATTSMAALRLAIPCEQDGNSVRCMQFSQQTFDVFVQDLFYTWGVGGAIISASRGLMANSFAQISTYAPATHAHLTPAFAATLPRSTCSTIKVVTMIGESLPQYVADDWAVDISAFNTYGPAEAAVVSTVCQFRGKDHGLRSSNIGKPLCSLSCYVLRDGQLAPRNAVGELALGGPQLAQGYLNDSEKTSQKFIWNKEIHKRLYLTGDLVRMLADGSLEFLGRQDDLVKLQGIRVELSEITFALRACHPSVRQIETCYFSRKDRPVKVIVTFLSLEQSTIQAGSPIVVTNDLAINIANSAKTKARETLPDVMTPATFVVINCVPRTTSVKTDVKTLKALYESIDLGKWESATNPKILRNGHDHAGSAVEFKVLDAIASISKVPVEAIDHSTYLPAIGLDSIAVAKLATALEEEDICLNYSDLLKCRTVDDLLCAASKSLAKDDKPEPQYLDNNVNKIWGERVQDFLKIDLHHVLRVTSLQESLLAESLEAAPAYWNNRCYTLPSQINIDQLKSAWQDVCNGTEALRTSFLAIAELDLPPSDIMRRDTFLQAIYAHWDLAWSVVDLEERDLVRFYRERARSIASEHQRAAFRKPPWAITIIRILGRDQLYMMVTLYHALHDEVASDAILEDVWNAYNGLQSSDRRRQLSEVALCLTDVPNGSETTNFWKQQLHKYAEFSDVELPRLHGSDVSYRAGSEGAMLSRHTETEASDADLQNAARTMGISIAAIFRTAWSYIVLRYLEVPKAIIGETVSERLYHPHLKDAIAPMVSVVPVAVQVSQTAMSLFQDQESSAHVFRRNRNITSTALRKLLGRPKSQPLYPAVFNFLYDSPASHCPWPEVRDLTNIHVEHPLALTVYKSASNSQWYLEVFGSAAFADQTHLQLLCNQTSALLQAMIKYPNEPIAKLLNRASSDVISLSRSHLSKNRCTDSLTHASFWASHMADTHPEWTAVEVAHRLTRNGTKTTTWNFETLDQESNKIAAFIAKNGLRNRRIALCASRSLMSYAVILGIFKAGNTYLPIDEGLPDERKSFLLNDSGSPMIFTDSSAVTSVSAWPEQCSAINLDSEEIIYLLNSFGGTKRLTLGNPDDDAYLLYTSGSTGLPKGVLISHRNLCGFVEGLASFLHQCSPETHSLGGHGKFLGLASRAFDVHLCEMFLGWRLGLCAVTAPRETLLDDLLTALVELRVTHACFVPTLLDQSGIEPDHVPDLIYFSVGGEKLSRRVLDTWGQQDRTLVVNAYGPTEVAIGCCASRVASNSTTRYIGKPFGNTTAHVLLPGTTDYAIKGQSGELCITGDLVGNGYLQRPDLHAFVSDFYGQRMYRTGDVVRMMSDGSIEYLGRSDDQIKIRGQRIELGEVSECIKKSMWAEVDVATLILQHPNRRNPQLVSFVAPIAERSQRYGTSPIWTKSNSRMSTDARTACRDHLPAYMVPDFVVPTNAIPLVLTSGKADGKLLKQLFSSFSISELLDIAKTMLQENDSPRDLTDEEILVKDLLRHILGVDETLITHNTNFFELGLDSLTAITLSVNMRKAGFESSLKDILSAPTIEKLATVPRTGCRRSEVTAAECEYSKSLEDLELHIKAAQPSDLSLIQMVRPCLPLQEGLVARSLSGARATVYVNHILLNLRNDIQPDRILQAWFAIIKKTQILRTCFRQVGNHFAQFVLSPGAMSLGRFFLSTSEQEKPLEGALNEIRNRATRSIIDQIEYYPPLRMSVIQSDEGSFLSISIHHAMYDAVSFNLVMNDVCDFYLGHQLSSKTPFDTLLGQVNIQKESDQKAFWMEYLAGVTRSRMLIHSEEARDTYIERKLSLKLSSLRSLASRLKVTASILSQTCFGVVISRLVQQKDIVFGVILSGRSVPIPQPEKIVAPCLTTIPQRINFGKGASSLAEIIQDVQERFAECLEYQHTSLRQIQRWVGIDLSLFDCLFQYLGELEQAPRYLELWTQEASTMPFDYPLAVEFEPDSQSNEVNTRLSCRLTPDALYDPGTILEQIDTLLQALDQNENLSIDAVGIGETNIIPPVSEAPKFDEDVYAPGESIMRKIVVEVCGIEPSSVNKSIPFFQLGIDSVTAIQFSRNLRGAGLEVFPSEVMRYPCIGSLYRHLKDKPTRQEAQQVEKDKGRVIEPFAVFVKDIPLIGGDDTIQATYPCTPLQSGMLSASLASGRLLYFHHHIVRLKDIQVAKLGHAWREVAEKNEILRTSFHFFESRTNPWIGAVHSSTPLSPLRYTQAESLKSYTNALERRRAFNTAEAFKTPPLLANLVKIESQEYFVLSMHHVLYDGISVPMIFHDLSKAYNSRSLQQRPSFREAAELVQHRSSTSVYFWLQSLKGFRPVQLPSKQIQTEKTANYLERKSCLDLMKLLRAAQSLGVTLQSIALLAYGKLLARLYGQRDIVFGHVVSGRSLPLEGCESIIGPLFNTVPLRIKLLDLLQSNQNFLSHLQSFLARSLDHQHAALQNVQHAWREESKSFDTPLIAALFVFQRAGDDDRIDNHFLEPSDTDLDNASPEYPLNLEFEQGSTDILVKISSFPSFASKDELATMIQEFEDIIEDIIDCPKKPTTAFPVGLSDLPYTKPKAANVTIAQRSESSEDDVESSRLRKNLSDLSGVPQRSISDSTSIFALGIDSIQAIKLASNCKRNGINIGVGDIMHGQTIHGILQRRRGEAKEVQDTNEDNTDLGLDLVEADWLPQLHVEAILPCLGGQNYHLAKPFMTSLDESYPMFFYSANTLLDVKKLQQAWDELRVQSPLLRTIFAQTSGQCAQIVLKGTQLESDNFEVLITEELSAAYDESTIMKRYMAQQKNEAFNSHKPPNQLVLLEAPKKHILALTLHHALYDAWSIQLLTSDLQKLYNSHQCDPRPNYIDFVRHNIRSKRRHESEAYWRDTLRRVKPTLIKSLTSLSPPSFLSPERRPSTAFISFPSALSSLSSLQNSCKSYSLSLPSLLLLAFSRHLASATRNPNPIFGYFLLGRSSSFPNIEQLAGPCMNVLPLRVRDASADNPIAVARRIQADLASRAKYEQDNLGDVLRWVKGNDRDEEGSEEGEGKIERSTATNVDKETKKIQPLFNTYLNILPGLPPPTADQGELESALDPSADNEGEKEVKFTPLPVSQALTLGSAGDADKYNGDDGKDGQHRAIIEEKEKAKENASSPPSALRQPKPKPDWPLATQALYVDIALNTDGESADIAAKSEGGLMSEEEIREWVGGLLGEVERLRDMLERKMDGELEMLKAGQGSEKLGKFCE